MIPMRKKHLISDTQRANLASHFGMTNEFCNLAASPKTYLRNQRFASIVALRTQNQALELSGRYVVAKPH